MRTVGGMPKIKECLSMRLKYFKIVFRQGIGNRVVMPAMQKVNGDLRPVYLPMEAAHFRKLIDNRLLAIPGIN